MHQSVVSDVCENSPTDACKSLSAHIFCCFEHYHQKCPLSFGCKFASIWHVLHTNQFCVALILTRRKHYDSAPAAASKPYKATHRGMQHTEQNTPVRLAIVWFLSCSPTFFVRNESGGWLGTEKPKSCILLMNKGIVLKGKQCCMERETAAAAHPMTKADTRHW